MPFPENIPNALPPTDDLLAGWPADAAAEPAPARRAWASRLFRRYERPPMRPGVRYALHVALFLATLVTTILAGVQIVRQGPEGLALDVFALPAAQRWVQLGWGLAYAGPFLGVLAVHEFGHYFVARYNQVRTSLPYFLPVPFGLGTFGAVIRIKERIYSRREFFDIGLAGPLAGLLVAVPLLAYAFAHLPDPVEYLLVTNPQLGRTAPEWTLAHPLLYQLLEKLFADPSRVPAPNQLLHYPLLVAGELSLFFTALNLLPIGQLDGGHILYGLLAVAALVWVAQLAVATLWPGTIGQPGWLVFGLLLGRLSGIYHPAAPDERPLSRGRQVLGWALVLLFILCFSSAPFEPVRWAAM